MITLKALQDGMAASGRPLTERAARDWWSKGLLPRPRRRGLGQGKGTETYWTDERVRAQAEAAYDLLTLHSRTYSVAAHLWLLGFPIELALVRGAYHRMLSRHFRLLRAQNDPDEKISALAAQVSRHLVRNGQIPRAIRDHMTDLAKPFLEIFFTRGVTFEEYGLSEYWAKVEPHLWSSKGAGALALNDHQLALAASYLSRMGSLAAQQDAIRTASDYELIRARRLLLFVSGYIRRLADLSGPHDLLDTDCRNLSIALSRPALPILVMMLREDWLRRCVTGFLLDTAREFRQLRRSKELADAPACQKGGQLLELRQASGTAPKK